MLHIDLFSGIGGFSLAADTVWPGIQHVFCDNDLFCQTVLKKHWPNAPIYGDIRQFTANTERKRNGRSVGDSEGETRTAQATRQVVGTGATWNGGADSVFILTGGFPCQPFSQAGRRKGTSDDRHLWPEMLRVIREFSPQWVIGENVGGFVTWNDGMVLRQVFTDLEGEGYEVQAFVIPACAVNAPHRRDRVWIVANRNGQRLQKRQTKNRTRLSSVERDDRNASTEDASDTTGGGRRRRENSKEAKRFQGHNESQRRTWKEPWLAIATRLCGVFNGLSEELDEGKLSKYAAVSQKITGQNLPHLWQHLQSETFREKVGGRLALLEPDYLFTVLWKLAYGAEEQDYAPFESAETQEAFMRNVWHERKIGRASRRWEYQEQYANEHKDTLSSLSYEVALATAEIKKEYLNDRSNRLKALGNAIVPQVAIQIMQAIKTLDSTPTDTHALERSSLPES